MAKFLNTSATTHYLDQLMKQTREQLIVISPFLQFNDRIKELLSDLNRMKTDIHIVYGKSELPPQEINWLHSLDSVRTHFCKNLHAKCYMNEREAIITSMNLYEFSQVNNNEIGVYFRKDEEPELYRETAEEARRLIRISESVRLSAEKVELPTDVGKFATAKVAVVNGNCIRCEKKIDYDPEKPLCPDCFKLWNRYKDPEYTEHYCHRCRKENQTSLSRPLCRSCYQAVRA